MEMIANKGSSFARRLPAGDVLEHSRSTKWRANDPSEEVY